MSFKSYLRSIKFTVVEPAEQKGVSEYELLRLILAEFTICGKKHIANRALEVALYEEYKKTPKYNELFQDVCSMESEVEYEDNYLNFAASFKKASEKGIIEQMVDSSMTEFAIIKYNRNRAIQVISNYDAETIRLVKEIVKKVIPLL